MNEFFQSAGFVSSTQNS